MGITESTRAEVIIAMKSEGAQEIIRQQRKVVENFNNQSKRMTASQVATNRVMHGGAQQLVENASRVNAVAEKHKSFLSVLGMERQQFTEFNKQGGEFNTKSARSGNAVRKFTQGLKGFRMEMLGVLFFGMAIQKFFVGLIKPALELTGLFKLMSVTLQVVFLPIALLLLDVLMPLFMWLINLDEATKLWIGKLVLIGIAVGAAMLVFGIFMLGIGSMIDAFGGLFNILDRLIPDVELFGISISGILEAALGAGIVLKLWQTFKGVIEGALQKFLGLDAISDLLDRLGIKTGENTSIWETLTGVIEGSFNKIAEKLNLDIEFGDLTKNLTDFEVTIGETSKTVGEWIDEFTTGLDEVDIEQLTTDMSDLTSVLTDMLPSLKTMAELMASLANSIITISSVVRFGAAGARGALTVGQDPLANMIVEGSIQQEKGRTSFVQNITQNISTFDADEMVRVIRDETNGWLDRMAATSPQSTGG